jgi:hypothetical protein
MSSNEIMNSVDINVLNEEDITYPYLSIINPKEEFYNNRINIEVKSSDPEGIAKVQYNIDNGSWKDLSSEGSDMYTGSWTPTWDGWHWLTIKTEDTQGYETEDGIKFETDSTPPSLMLNSFSNDISAVAEFDLDIYDYSSLLSLKYRINSGIWTELDRDEENVQFTWDSTKYDDGECLMEIECTDNWGGVSTLYRNLDVKNQGLIYSIPPSDIVTEEVTKITSIVDYENPKSVYMILAKIDVDVLAEGQKIPMNKEGNYYIGEIYFENPGLYVYSIEVDTGHGKLSSYEQNILVSAKQSITKENNDGNMLLSPNILPAILMVIFVALRRKD